MSDSQLESASSNDEFTDYEIEPNAEVDQDWLDYQQLLSTELCER